MDSDEYSGQPSSKARGLPINDITWRSTGTNLELTVAEEFGELRNVIPGVLQNEAVEITSDASRIELGQDLGAILGISMLIVINRTRTGKQKN